jgi:D-xylose transport system ATP-binding protein
MGRHGLPQDATDVTALVEFRNIVKTFGGVHAVQNVSLDLGDGEVLGLLGHNGAGKSTLIKILSGVFTADSGEIRFAGKPVVIRSTRDAKSLGIETIYQTLALSENLDAVANLFLGREVTGWLGFMNEEAMEEQTRITLQRLRLRLPHLSNLVASLSIARAIHFNAKVLIMDEPTAALGPEETKKVAALISELSRQGIGIILISHDINDVFDLASRLAVMKNGRLVGTVRTEDVTKDDVLAMIIAGKLPQQVPT